MKIQARVGALESKMDPPRNRVVHLLGLDEGQTEQEAIQASGFDPNDVFIFIVGFSQVDRAEGANEAR